MFAALREVKRGRADVAPRFMQHLESTLARLDASTTPAAAAPRRSGELSLVENSDLDELVTVTRQGLAFFGHAGTHGQIGAAQVNQVNSGC